MAEMNTITPETWARECLAILDNDQRARRHFLLTLYDHLTCWVKWERASTMVPADELEPKP